METFTAPGLTFSNGVALTCNVTGITKGLFPVPAEVDKIVTAPVQVPGTKPEILIATATVPGVVPLDGVAVRNAPPQFVEVAVTP